MLFVLRLVRRETVQQAVSGFLGIAVAAYIASRTGEAKGFFLLGIWASFVYAGIFAASVLVRWPLVGVIWEYVDGAGADWRRDRRADAGLHLDHAGLGRRSSCPAGWCSASSTRRTGPAGWRWPGWRWATRSPSARSPCRCSRSAASAALTALPTAPEDFDLVPDIAPHPAPAPGSPPRPDLRG